MNLEQVLTAPEESLAIGVLKQAVHDLRRFRGATGKLERELYLDAYRWITANDFGWPYSFVNICEVLDVPPEILQAELLGDVSLGWFAYWRKLGARVARSVRVSMVGVLPKSRAGDAAPLSPSMSLRRL
jgi:hypothetical protein